MGFAILSLGEAGVSYVLLRSHLGPLFDWRRLNTLGLTCASLFGVICIVGGSGISFSLLFGIAIAAVYIFIMQYFHVTDAFHYGKKVLGGWLSAKEQAEAVP